LVGTSFAKSLSIALNIPLIPVNHMQAHVLAHFIKEENYKKPTFPFLCLTISGGHTQILRVNHYNKFEILGETIDDAVGEAFDKTAKLLGLPYPGGPLIDKYAKNGNKYAFKFTEPKTSNALDFSFSGLKTAILYFLQKEQKKNKNFIQENLNDICASIQHVIVNILINKLKLASKLSGITNIAIAGGVSANSEIRVTLKECETSLGWNTYIPKFEYTTDNAAMIGIAGYYKFLNNDFKLENTVATSRLRINE
jgi:N6-L-threonylcarbamoyladenine synthase